MTIVGPAYLTSFGSVTIPGARGRFQWPAGAVPSIIPTIGGSFDTAGSGAAGFLLPYTLTYTGAAVHATDTTEVQDDLDALRAVAGSYDVLTLALADGTTRSALARLESVSPEMVATDRAVLTFVLTFQVRTIWNGTVHGGTLDVDFASPPIRFANGYYADGAAAMTLDTSPITVTLWNGGNAPVHNAGLVLWVNGGAAITYLKIALASIAEWEFTGTLAAGKALFIDCGARIILNDGVDAFKDWHRTANHLTDKWLTLLPGNNDLVLTFTGGGIDSTLEVAYSDGWA